MASILYLSYTGILDPLGQSQVLQYVLGLAPNHKITLITFEKPELLKQADRLTDLERECRLAGINWCRLTYHGRPGIPATIYDIVVGAMKAVVLARKERAGVVHARSYIAGLMALAVKWLTGARFIFDMRGFWPDERVDGDIWSKTDLAYRVSKRAERHLFLDADHVVSLTRAGVREFANFEYLRHRCPPVSVIPTCTSLELFRPGDKAKGGFTLGYLGSAGSWYLFDDVARAVAHLFVLSSDARFLVVNKGGHARICAALDATGIDMSRVELLEASFDKVGEQISRMDAGIFFIKPAWSKRASCPTRLSEFLACGKPVLTNAGVGDVREILSETNTGIALPVTDQGRLVTKDLEVALRDLFELAGDPETAERCRAAAESHFSLARGIAEYERIYRRLATSAA